jgi:TonB-linked SusC/RagA family outer membrane protein
MTQRKLHFSMLFLLISQLIFAQAKVVKGIVYSKSDGGSLYSVNIAVEGKSAKSSTGFDGTFIIEAASGDVLTFSFLGFASKKVTVGDSKNLTVYLSEEAATLNQVVVVGSTSKVSRKELGNAITSVKSKELLRAQPNSLTSALQGKVAGAQITQNSGDPSGGFSIKLRGTSSIVGSSDPLYVIDGVVMNNSTRNINNLDVGTNSNMQIGQNRSSDINPNDIESVEVINGGAAAAIYGSRAANGVVLITTKKGKAGKTKYTFSSNSTVNSLRKKVYTNLSDRQFENTIALAGPPPSFAPTQTLFTINAQPAAYVALNPGDFVEVNKTVDPFTGQFTSGTFLSKKFTTGNIRYDYQDDIFNQSYGTDNYFSMNGGDDKSKYFASLGYLVNEGIVRNADFKRFNAKLRLDHNFNNYFSASFGINYINSASNEKPDGNRFWSPVNSINITNNIYDINRRNNLGQLLAVETNRVNPLSVINDIVDTQQTDRIISDLQFNFKPLKNLSIDYIFGLDTFNQQGTTFIPKYPYAVVGINAVPFPDGYASEAFNKVTQFNNDLNIKHTWNINDTFKATTSGGYNIQTYRDKFNAVSGRDLKPFIETLSAFNTPIANIAEKNPYNLWGFYIQETLGIANKLFLTGAIRTDASTAFGDENRSNLYKKASASFVISEFDYFKDSRISTARVRASWGESGNLSGVGPYARFTNYSTSNIGAFTTYTLAGLRRGNLNIKPEVSVTTEAGLDLGFFKDRITVSGTYYDAKIQDLLLSVQAAASSGVASDFKNIGTMTNKGFEVTLKADVIQNENFTLGFFGTYSKNKNQVTGLTNQTFFQLDSNEAGAPVFVKVGSPIGIYYGTYYARNPDGSLLLTPEGYPQQERGSAVTNIPARDLTTGQPVGATLNKEIGDPNPDFLFSAGLNFTHKRLSGSILFDGSKGGDIFDADYRTRQGVGLGKLANQELTGELPRGYIASIYPIQEFRVVDGSFVKLREIALNYSFGKVTDFIDDLTVTASGRNLYSWDKFPSYDPEVNAAGQSSIAKYNFGSIPIPRTVSLALKFQF